MRPRLPASAGGRVAFGAAVVIVALNLAVLAADALLPGPRGPASSAYATSPRGLAAWAELLERSGHPVRRLRERPDRAELDPRATVVVLDPDVVLPGEANALRDFVERGGRLVAGGEDPEAWVGEVTGSPVSWTPAGPARWRADAGAARTVTSVAEGAWSPPGAGSVTVAAPTFGAALVLERDVGAGRAVLLADASPLSNALLAEADNAALALALAGEPRRPVHFAEAVHGFGEGRGLGALPWRWKLALAGLGLAALLLVLAHARRLGPPDPQPPRPVPPRRAYVDAVAATLERAGGHAEAAAAIQAELRRRLPEREHARLEPVRDEAGLVAAARELAATGTDPRGRPR